jgi:hypothetical protein
MAMSGKAVLAIVLLTAFLGAVRGAAAPAAPEAAVKEAEAALDAAKTQWVVAQAEAVRRKAMADQRQATAEQVDEAGAAVALARADVVAAEVKLQAAKMALAAPAKTPKEVAEVAAQRARIDAELAQVELDKTKVRLERIAALASRGAATEKDLAAAQVQVRAAMTNVEATGLKVRVAQDALVAAKSASAATAPAPAAVADAEAKDRAAKKAQAMLNAVQAVAEKTAADRDRLKVLHARGMATDQELAAAAAACDASLAAVAAAEKQLQAALNDAKAAAGGLRPAAVPPVAVAAPTVAPGPPGKVVYRSNFAKGGGPEWWPRWTSQTPVGARPFLGEFGIEPATLTLRNLPAHKFIRINMSLLMLRPMDGSSTLWGPDPWEMRILGGPRLLYTTFDNCCFFNNNNEQAFPDEYPWAIHSGWTGAAEKQTLGYPYTPDDQRDTSSVYRLTLVVPHDTPDLRLLMRALWSEYKKEAGETWGLESMEIETLDGPAPLTPKELEILWADLGGQDGPRAFQALWRMVAAGEQSALFIKGRIGKPAEAAPAPEVQPPAPKPEDEIDRLVKELDDPSFQVRERATQRLIEIGRPMLGNLRRLAQTSESPEVRVRLRKVVDALANQSLPVAAPVPPPAKLPADVGSVRAARVLELIGGPAGMEALDLLTRSMADKPAASFVSASRLRLAERMIDELLARADAAGLVNDLPGAEAFCAQAQKLAKTYLPEDAGRAAAALEDCRERAKERATAARIEGEAARRQAMRRQLAVADDLAAAAKLADDPQDREALALAAKPPETLSEKEAAALRAFYLKETKGAEGPVLAGLVARALAVARPDGQPTEKAFDPTAGIDRDILSAYLAREAARGRWADLLPLIDLRPIEEGFNRIPHNEWRREWHGPKGGASPPTLCLPGQPAGSYQLRLSLIPVGVETITLGVPVGGRRVSIDLRPDGAVTFSTSAPVGGKWVDVDLKRGREFTAEVTVRQDAGGAASVQLAINGHLIVTWKGKLADIPELPAAGKPPTGPTLDMQGGWVLMRAAALRMLDGKVKLAPVQQPGAGPAGQPQIRLQFIGPGGGDVEFIDGIEGPLID